MSRRHHRWRPTRAACCVPAIALRPHSPRARGPRRVCRPRAPSARPALTRLRQSFRPSHPLRWWAGGGGRWPSIVERSNTLYALAAEYLDTLALLEDDAADADALEQQLDGIAGLLTQKADNIAALVQHIEGMATPCERPRPEPHARPGHTGS